MRKGGKNNREGEGMRYKDGRRRNYVTFQHIESLNFCRATQQCVRATKIKYSDTKQSKIDVTWKTKFMATSRELMLTNNCCFSVHFDKHKTILPKNAPFIKT